MQKITPFLWFHDQAQEAAKFYVSVFPGSKILSADAQSARFLLAGQEYIAFNGGSYFSLTPAFSLTIDCVDQTEIDHLWETLSDGGEKSQCGWLIDRWGLSWQVVPTVLGKLLSDPDPVKAKRVLDAMMQMKKIVIADLEKAHEGR